MILPVCQGSSCYFRKWLYNTAMSLTAREQAAVAESGPDVDLFREVQKAIVAAVKECVRRDEYYRRRVYPGKPKTIATLSKDIRLSVFVRPLNMSGRTGERNMDLGHNEVVFEIKVPTIDGFDGQQFSIESVRDDVRCRVMLGGSIVSGHYNGVPLGGDEDAAVDENIARLVLRPATNQVADTFAGGDVKQIAEIIVARACEVAQLDPD